MTKSANKGLILSCIKYDLQSVQNSAIFVQGIVTGRKLYVHVYAHNTSSSHSFFADIRASLYLEMFLLLIKLCVRVSVYLRARKYLRNPEKTLYATRLTVTLMKTRSQICWSGWGKSTEAMNTEWVNNFHAYRKCFKRFAIPRFFRNGYTIIDALDGASPSRELTESIYF